MDKRSVSVVVPDGGWGWVVMVASFFNSGAMYGCIKTSGILYVAMMNHLQLSRTEAALIPSLAFSISCLLGPLASSLSIRYSYRTVIFFGAICASTGIALTAVFLHSYPMVVFCYGVVMGIGCGMVGTPNLLVVHSYFDRHRALASGISLAGSSVAGFLVPPLVEWIIDNHGLHAALVTLSAIVMQICPVALLFRPLKQKVARNRATAKDLNGFVATNLMDSEEHTVGSGIISANGDKTFTVLEKKESASLKEKFFKAFNIDPSIFHKKYFYLLTFGFLMQTYAWAGYLTLLPDYALHEASEPVDPSMSALLLSYMCIGDVIFRIISGWLMDKLPYARRPYAYIALLFAASIVMYGYTFSQPYTGLVVSSVAVGIIMSGVIVIQPVLLRDITGDKRFPMALGICVAANGFIVLVSAPSLAFIREKTGSYKPSFLMMALGLLIPACVWLVDTIIVQCRRRRSHIVDDNTPVEV